MEDAYAYAPRWEIWYNGAMYQQMMNCIMSFSQSETHSQVIPGLGPQFVVKVGPDRFNYNVRLWRSMLLKSEREDPAFKKNEEAAKKEKWPEMALFTAIVDILHAKGHIRFKPPRDLADD
jgi:hypothetical protein